MSTIQTIIDAFKTFPTNGDPITLKPQTFNLDFVDAVFNFLLQSDEVAFTSTTVTINEDQSATLKGTADLFEYNGIVITLTFSVSDGLVVAKISCDLGASSAVHVPLITWISFGNATFEGQIKETEGLAAFNFSSTINLDGGGTVPITLAYQADGTWALTVADGTDQSLTGAEVASLLGGSTLTQLLPSSLESKLSSLSLTGLEATFNTKSDELTYFNTGFSLSDTWPIAPGVSLDKGLGLSFTLTEQKDDDSGDTAMVAPGSGSGSGSGSDAAHKIDAQVQGTLKLGGVAVPLRITATIEDEAIWQFGLQPGKTSTIPSFSDLLALGGDSTFIDSLPAAISTLPSIDVNSLNVTFDSTKDELQEVSFEVQTGSTWEVLPGYFELNELKLDFDITNVNTPDKRQVVGDAYGAFSIGTSGFFCEIKNTKEDQDWVISGGLLPKQTLNITTLASDMFGGALAVPDDAPQIVFTNANLTVTPSANTFKLAAGSDQAWVLIADKLSIETLSLDLSRAPKESSSETEAPAATDYTYTGNLKGTIEIGGVTVDLSAALNATPDAGVDFNGTTDDQSIPFGTWLDAFANLFGQVELPGWLTGITLSALSVTYNTKSKDYTFGATVGDTDIPGLEILVTIAVTHDGGTWKQQISASLTYQGDDVDLRFLLTFTTKTGADSKKTYTTYAVYSGNNPPSLSQFLLLLGKALGVESEYPQALNWDATLTKLIVVSDEASDKSNVIHAAGQFDLDLGGDKDWSLFFSYSNDTSFEDKSDGANSDAQDAPADKPPYVFGLALSGPMELSKLPLVGDIPGIEVYDIDKLGFYYTNATFPNTKSELTFSIPDLDQIKAADPTYTKAKVNQPKFNLLALFDKDTKGGDGGAEASDVAASSPSAGSDSDDTMSLGAPTDATDGTPAFTDKQTTTSAPVAWIPLNKSIGPVSLDKVGLSYSSPPKGQDGELGIFGVYFDGGFSISGFELYLDALGITFPLPKPSGAVEDPIAQIQFHLNGLFLNFEKPNLKIAGGFLNLPGEKVDMLGQLSVDAGPYGLEAYGGYSGEISDPSLFLFMHLNAPIGGPPCFFIDGVSGGVGLNRDFKLPGFADLASYPLLPSGSTIPTMTELGDKSATEKLQAMQTALQNLAKYMPTKPGNYWFAAGLDVTTYEMIKSSAILSISFGTDPQMAVVGSAGMTLPVDAGSDPLAYIQINFLCSYSFTNDRLSILGEITPSSFILTKEIRLGGGFAFYVWLDGPNSGDFVLSIGGYSPFYNKPAQYPDVPRLSLNAKIDILTIQGEGYFALVPNALMAGIDVKATADLGPVSAWFHASADFLIGWKPFTYEGHVGIVIGARFSLDIGFVTISMTIHVGVGLDVWGPDFGGRAVVDLSIISFTIDFGSAKQDAPLLDWDEFVKFLPSKTEDGDNAVVNRATPIKAFALMEAPPQAAAPTTKTKILVSVDVKKGLIPADKAAAEASKVDWVVDPNHFVIRTHCSAPSNAIEFNGEALSQDTANYLRPGNLRQQIEDKPAILDLAPQIIDPAPAGSDPEWFDVTIGMPPSGLTDLKSTLVTTLEGPKGRVEGIMIRLVKTGVPLATWGGADPQKASDGGLMGSTVVGVEFRPRLYFPSNTSYIQYYYLVFSTNNVFLEQDTAPVLDSTPFTNKTQILENMINGTAFSSTETTRGAVVDALAALGFDKLTLKNSSKLSTQDYVQQAELVHMTTG